jgi:hypothetical protein
LELPYRTYVIAGDLPFLKAMIAFRKEFIDFIGYLNVLRRTQAELGAARAGWGWISQGYPGEEGPLHAESVMPFIRNIPRNILLLGKELPALGHLDLDLSQRAYYLDPIAKSMNYMEWLTAKIDQLMPHINIAEIEYDWGNIDYEAFGKDFWISASYAAEIATALELKLSTSDITKLCDENPNPFAWRKPSDNRRQVHLVSFLVYVLKERQRRGGNESQEDPAMDKRIADASKQMQLKRPLN